ncbi:MAG: sigma-70 family RNA polymerase sigma factor [Candidatus Marinimicrobia bacterium]|nr:sigma-70 family RNA polymerase sigma factor [Candidatus Neomarinimicrobiota bacterium]
MNQNSSTLFTMPLDNKINKYNYTDEKLMSLFQGGDENAYIVLVNRYKDKLINFIYHYLKDSESAEDVVQETMIKLYQKKHYYKEIAKFSTWLYTIAKNLANTELRKRKNRKITLLSHFSNDDKTYEIPSDDLEIGQQVQTDVVNEIIKNAVNQLSEKFKTVIILRDIQEISYEEISEIIGIPIGTVKSRINRARLQLQVELKYLRE